MVYIVISILSNIEFEITHTYTHKTKHIRSHTSEMDIHVFMFKIKIALRHGDKRNDRLGDNSFILETRNIHVCNRLKFDVTEFQFQHVILNVLTFVYGYINEMLYDTHETPIFTRGR